MTLSVRHLITYYYLIIWSLITWSLITWLLSKYLVTRSPDFLILQSANLRPVTHQLWLHCRQNIPHHHHHHHHHHHNHHPNHHQKEYLDCQWLRISQFSTLIIRRDAAEWKVLHNFNSTHNKSLPKSSLISLHRLPELNWSGLGIYFNRICQIF